MLDAILAILQRGLASKHRARGEARLTRRGARVLGETVGPRIERIESRTLLSAVNVLTFHNNNLRTGVNSDETVLTPSNVNDSTFGKVGTLPVDGQVYGQPLYESHVAFPGGKIHNVLFVVTENDSVYAFNANGGALIWHDSLAHPSDGITPIPATVTDDTTDLTPIIGITSTPVIDPNTGTIYTCASFQITKNGVVTYEQRLYALNIVTGAEDRDVLIKASAPGNGNGSVNGIVSFNALRNLQRSALTLNNGHVYIAWSSHGDTGTYHGWIIGYNAATFAQTFAWTDTPNGSEGGIWSSGDGLAVDQQGDMFALIGNGTFDEDPSLGDMNDYGESIVEFNPGSGHVNDFFAVDNYNLLNVQDLDLNSGGIMLMTNLSGPNSTEAVFSGKQGTIYVTDTADLGGFNANTNNDVEELSGDNGLASSFDTPAYFDNRVYYEGAYSDELKYYPVVNGQLNASGVVFGGQSYTYPGASPEISANGTSNGIVWIVGDNANGHAELDAYNANTLSEIYTSEQNPSRDQAGTFNKFAPPTIANGRVFVAAQGEIDIYGLL
jgi:hypothetical protein